MKQLEIDQNWILRFELGESFTEALSLWANSNNIKGAFFYGIGGARSVNLGFYDLDKKQYNFKELSQPLEVVSLQGNIGMIDERIKVHAHGVFSDENYSTFGGHVKDLTVGPTLEVVVKRLKQPLSRQHDDEIGLDLLDFHA